MIWSREWDLLALASLSLEEFSVSFLRDAQNFFANLGGFWYWSHLTRFAMPSKLLAEGVSPDDVHRMLISAATAARQDLWTPEVTFRQEVIDPGPISSHAAAISALKLVNQVIRPISRQQIHLENLQRRKISQGNHWQYHYAMLDPLIAARRAVIAESLPAASTEPPAAGSGTATPPSRRSSKRKCRPSE